MTLGTQPSRHSSASGIHWSLCCCHYRNSLLPLLLLVLTPPSNSSSLTTWWLSTPGLYFSMVSGYSWLLLWALFWGGLFICLLLCCLCLLFCTADSLRGEIHWSQEGTLSQRVLFWATFSLTRLPLRLLGTYRQMPPLLQSARVMVSYNVKK